MHPPLKIIDQTDEMIAIEWLREYGYNSYADHMECKPEGTAVFDCIPTQIWIHMTYESTSSSRSRDASRSYNNSRRGSFCFCRSSSSLGSTCASYTQCGLGGVSRSGYETKTSGIVTHSDSLSRPAHIQED